VVVRKAFIRQDKQGQHTHQAQRQALSATPRCTSAADCGTNGYECSGSYVVSYYCSYMGKCEESGKTYCSSGCTYGYNTEGTYVAKCITTAPPALPPPPSSTSTPVPSSTPTATPKPTPTPSSTSTPSPSASPTPDPKCKEAYGDDYQECGEGGSGMTCCKKSDLCCGGSDSSTAVCCNSVTSSCGGALGYNYCKGKDCESRGLKTCEASFWPTLVICCPKDSVCGVQSKSKDTPFCGANSCNKEGYNPNPCYTDSNGANLCCKTSESCVDVINKDNKISGKKVCSAKSCKSDEELCTGKGTNKFMTICCKLHTCYWHPYGLPMCQTPVSG